MASLVTVGDWAWGKNLKIDARGHNLLAFYKIHIYKGLQVRKHAEEMCCHHIATKHPADESYGGPAWHL